MNPDELIRNACRWSEQEVRVIALGLCGSYARGEQRSDSDIDFCILTPEPEALLEDLSWVTELGCDARIIGPVEDYKLVQSVRVRYGPTEAEFGVTDEAWATPPIDPETAGVINDGLRILLDPDGKLERARVFAEKLRPGLQQR